jgi:hypothetical protein
VRPHESGLWSRRYCEVQIDEGMLYPSRMPYLWAAALHELRVPLRALLAFYGEGGLRARSYPPWAVADIRAIDLRPICLGEEGL